MRSFLIVLVVVLVVLAALGFYLVASTPRQGADIHARLNLISQVPGSAEAFAIIPTAAALDAKLQANPITRAAVEQWRANQRLPRAWMIGDADLIAWKSGGTLRYFLRLDPFRAFIVRMYMMAGGSIGNTLMINVPGEQPIDSSDATQIAELASRLPKGDALVVQRQNSRGAYPPIARPAVTSVQVTASEIRLVSVGPPPSAAAVTPSAGPAPKFPRQAILSAAFTSPPRVVGELNRLFGAKISTLFDSGGMLCIDGVDMRKLLPRPLGVIVLPDDPARRAIVDSFRQAESVGIHTRTGEKDGMLLVSFDNSIEQYQKDVFDPPATVGNQWTVRIDPARLVPILNDLGQNLGLRIAAPRIFRNARDLDRWIGGLEQAKVIEASDSADSGGETIQVRIAAK